MPWQQDKTKCRCGHERWQHNGSGQCVIAIWDYKRCRCKAFVAEDDLF